jgi:hypothetical protein
MENNPVSTTAPMPMVMNSFRDRDSAERAFAELTTRGYTDKEIHVLMLDSTRKRLFTQDELKTSNLTEADNGHKALAGAGVGGAVGGAVGATLVAILATGAGLAIPGLGLVIVGPLAGALAGGATGAAAGGLVGTLVGAGISDDRAKLYDKDIQDGSIVLGFTPRNEDDARSFENEWRTSGARV